MMENDVTILMCFGQFLISIFTYDAPLEISVRIMDLFLLEGEGVLFNVIFTLVQLKREKILATDGSELYTYLKKEMLKECYEENLLISNIFY